MFMRIAAELIEHGTVRRACIGVDIDADFTPSKAAQLGLPRSTGALISGVAADSPAAAARIRPGDVVLNYDGTPVENDSHLVTLVGLTAVGKSVTLHLFRDAKVVQASLVTRDQDHLVMQASLRNDR
jgi:serine protease Do